MISKTMKCKRGQIKIASYKNKKGTTVKAHCKTDLGKSGKGRKLFTVKKGDLTKYCYSLKIGKDMRHAAIKKALKSIDKNTMIRKLNVLAILHKNTNPKYAARARHDLKFVQSL